MKLKIQINKESVNKIFSAIFKSRGLIFVIFWGIVLIYSFNIIYKKAYVEVNFIDYPPYESSLNVNKETVTLKKITEDMSGREENLKSVGDKKYSDPFSFKGDKPDSEAVDQSDGENVLPAGGGSYSSLAGG